MSEVHNTERAKVSNGVKRTKPPAANRKAETKPSPWKTPLLVVGAGALGAAAMAAVLVTNQRRSRAYRKRSEPSFLGALVKAGLLSAARSLTAHLMEKTLLPQLPVLTPTSASGEKSPR